MNIEQLTERELLELAAKAAGYAVDCAFHDSDGWPLIFSAEEPPRDWNPLRDDGDALRLAVAISAFINVYTCDNMRMTSCAGKGAGAGMVVTSHDDDPLQGTRLAITRAAAMIGAKMP